MMTFDVDDDLVDEVWKRANIKKFEQISFSDALRRVFQLSPSAIQGGPEPDDFRASVAVDVENSQLKEKSSAVSFGVDRARRKAKKADLVTLVQAGLLRDGQELALVDYQKNTVPGCRAVVSGRYLKFAGAHHSMSGLARDLLKHAGFRSDTVRGPKHWATESGSLVIDLWDQIAERTV